MNKLATLGIFLGTLISLGVAKEATSQTTPCLSFQGSTNTASNLISSRFSNGMPRLWAWQYTATTPRVLRGMRVFTGNKYTDAFMSVEIWSDDSTNSLPGKRIAGGTWRAPKTPMVGWQGANFDRPVVLTTNVKYWFVWIEAGWSQVTFQANGTTQLQSAYWNGTAWASGAQQYAKIQLFCSQLDTKGAMVFGSSCNNAGGGTGTTFTNSSPTLDNADYRIEASGLPAGAPAVFILGVLSKFTSQPVATAPTCFLNADPTILIPTATGTGNVLSPTAAGHTWLPIPIPNNTALRGAFVAVQVAAFDAQSKNTLQLVFTNAMRSTVF